MSSTSIFGLNGAIKIDPGNINSSDHSFTFINASIYPICDLNITTWDADIYGATPEILPDGNTNSSDDGCTISTSELEEVTLSDGTKSARVKANSETIMERSHWSRSDSDSESDETRIVFKDEHCIAPGQVFSLNLSFDEGLHGNEGIIIAPSRKLNGKHYTFGGSEAEPAKPFTGKDLLELLGKLAGAVPTGLIGRGKGASNDSVAKFMKQSEPEMSLALKSALNEEYFKTSLSGLKRLPLEAINTIPKEHLYAFKEARMESIADLMENDTMQKVRFLYDLSKQEI